MKNSGIREVQMLNGKPYKSLLIPVPIPSDKNI